MNSTLRIFILFSVAALAVPPGNGTIMAAWDESQNAAAASGPRHSPKESPWTSE
jgi:hypothetical protein